MSAIVRGRSCAAVRRGAARAARVGDRRALPLRPRRRRRGDPVAAARERADRATLQGARAEDHQPGRRCSRCRPSAPRASRNTRTRVFAAWKLGQKGKDNGVLVVVAPKDRKMRIEVGYGLEGTLTDAIASRIIRNEMTPQFKSGDFDGGIADGVAGDRRAARRRRRAGGDSRRVRGRRPRSVRSAIDEPDLPPWPMRILLGAFIFGIIGLFTIVGVMTPGVGWFLYLFLIPFWAMFPIIIVGREGRARRCSSIYLVGYPDREAHRSAARPGTRRRRRSSRPRAHATHRRLHDELRRQQRLELVVGQLRRAADSRAAAAAPAAAAAREAGDPDTLDLGACVPYGCAPSPSLARAMKRRLSVPAWASPSNALPGAGCSFLRRR